jgi:lipopolysaccharide biosynthesis glycosyltransferase
MQTYERVTNMSTLNVLYQSNDYYSVVTGVSMTSLFENNKDLSEINIYILNDEISINNKDKMTYLCKKYNRKIFFIDTQEILRRLKELKVAPFKNTYTTYFKLMALNDLDIPGDNVLQLDGDTIINGSLYDLCTMDISHVLCAATYDCTMNKYKTLIDIPETDKYYNGGVLFINQKMWKSLQCEKQIVEHLKNVRNGYYTVDQDIINVLFRDKIKYLDLTYNFNSGFYIYGIKESLKMYNLKEPYYNSFDEISRVYKNPKIYHCMGAMTGRPWEKDSIHPQNDIFDHYLSISPWHDYEKVSIKRKKVFRIQRKLYQLLPRSFYIPIHKVAQARYLKSMNKAVRHIV